MHASVQHQNFLLEPNQRYRPYFASGSGGKRSDRVDDTPVHLGLSGVDISVQRHGCIASLHAKLFDPRRGNFTTARVITTNSRLIAFR